MLTAGYVTSAMTTSSSNPLRIAMIATRLSGTSMATVMSNARSISGCRIQLGRAKSVAGSLRSRAEGIADAIESNALVRTPATGFSSPQSPQEPPSTRPTGERSSGLWLAVPVGPALDLRPEPGVHGSQPRHGQGADRQP